MDHGQTPERAVGGGLAPWQVELASQLLLADLSAEVPGEQLASLCGLSRSYFAKAFKVSLGAPPHRWVVQERLRRAAEMLEATSESISVIALSCGFADQSHFTRAFREAVGVSPGAWRRRRRARSPPVASPGR
jgi:AraC family transcriptional regulator